jgi:hypothetical protein
LFAVNVGGQCVFVNIYVGWWWGENNITRPALHSSLARLVVQETIQAPGKQSKEILNFWQLVV